MTSMRTAQFSGLPHSHPFDNVGPKFFDLLEIGRSISNRTHSPFQMITNQLKKA